jgi:hypothetical protein
MKKYWLLISLVCLIFLLGNSCNKKNQKSKEKETQMKNSQDKQENIEIHAPKSDDPVEINRKKKEQTEKKLSNPNEGNQEGQK